MWARLCRQLERELAAKNAATQGKLMPRAKTVENVVDQPAVAAPDAQENYRPVTLIEELRIESKLGFFTKRQPNMMEKAAARIEQLERLQKSTQYDFETACNNIDAERHRAEKAEAALAEAQKEYAAAAFVTGNMMQEYAGMRDKLAAAQKTVEIRSEQIRCMTEWLDANQPNVWSRGIWDAMKAAIDAAKEKK